MLHRKSRFFICIIICVTLLLSQTLITFGEENTTDGQGNNIEQGKTEAPSFSENDPEFDDSGSSENPIPASNLSDSDKTYVNEVDETIFDTQSLEEELSLIEDITNEPVKGAEIKGYIVDIKDDKVDEIIEEEKDKNIIQEITDDKVVVENPEDLANFVSAGAISTIEPNYKITSAAFPQTPPNDPYYTSGGNYQWGLKWIQSELIWQSGYTGEGVTVAVFDTGLNNTHVDLDSDKVQIGWNCVVPTKITTNFADNHVNGHGSVVASIIAAQTNNGIGMAGITSDVNVITLKVLESDGTGYTSYVVAALEKLKKEKIQVDVMNFSLGHPGFQQNEYNLIKEFIDNGTIVVSASGNDGDNTGEDKNRISYPADYDGVIGVGSIKNGGGVSSFSTKNRSVDVTAPGENMVGISSSRNNEYRYGGSGTSFASPVVAAAAVYAKAKAPAINAQGFDSALRATSTDAGTAGRDTSYGYGILNLAGLSNYLDGNVGWSYINGYYYYFDSNYVMATGWKYLDGEYYYFAYDGKMQTGWVQPPDKKWYYLAANGKMNANIKIFYAGNYYILGSNGAMLAGGWNQFDGNWYYLASDGKAQKDWQKIGSYWYYMNSTGEMQTGFLTIDGKKYAFADAPSGRMLTGWVKSDGIWYYFNNTAQVGWLKVGSSWYYMNSEGEMQTGFITLGTKKYLLNASGIMQTGWVLSEGKWYYFNDAASVGWLKVGSNWYYMNAAGEMQTGIITVGTKKYAFADAPSGKMLTGWVQSDGIWYYFNSGGEMLTGQWLSSGGAWYYLQANGEMQTGWLTLGSNKYYLNSSTGKMLTGTWLIDGERYTFSSGGILIS